jgi:hypothetical protein
MSVASSSSPLPAAWLPLVIETGAVAADEPGAGSTTVFGAPAVALGCGAFLWTTIRRCLMTGLTGAAVGPAVGAVAAVALFPRPSPDDTDTAPATNEATTPPAVTIADLLFIRASFLVP